MTDTLFARKIVRTVSINRPHGDPRHLKAKGRPMFMEDGSVNVTCRNERGATYYIGVSADLLRQMADVLHDGERAR